MVDEFVVLVCGGRRYGNWRAVEEHLNALRTEHGDRLVVVEGGATGADAHARNWAIKIRCRYRSYFARWADVENAAVIRTDRQGRKYNALAGHDRNQRMLDEEPVALVLAFPGGGGTADMVDRARRSGVDVRRCGA